mmetsp:Transcript_8460/g.15043  ORF Transcript_8460/g.15043 Transcript_8460/m.15043 type:complete len:727 (-) Transcript_8460:110-2290(-)
MDSAYKRPCAYFAMAFVAAPLGAQRLNTKQIKVSEGPRINFFASRRVRVPTKQTLTMVQATAASAKIQSLLANYKMRMLPATILPVTAVNAIIGWLGESFLWNPLFKVAALFVMTAVFVWIGARLFKTFDPEEKEAKSPYWRSLRSIANPFEDDYQAWPLRFISIFSALGGAVFFGILCGIITESVDSGVDVLLKGRTRCVVQNHVLLVGWNQNSVEILKAMTKSKDAKTVVIMAENQSPTDVQKSIQESLDADDRKKLRILVRTGSPLLKLDMDRVAAEKASKIVLLSQPELSAQDSNNRLMGNLLALRQIIPSYSGEIIAELKDDREAGLVKALFRKTLVKNVEPVTANVGLGRFLVQSFHHPGLSSIINQMMSGEAKHGFHYVKAQDAIPSFVGRSLSDVNIYAIPNCIIVGYVNEKGATVFEPSNAITVDRKTELVTLGLPSSSAANAKLQPIPHAQAIRKTAHNQPCNILITGWRDQMEDMLIELDLTVSKGTVVHILADESCGCDDMALISRLNLKNYQIYGHVGSPDDMDALQTVYSQAKFDRVILLSPTKEGEETTDADGRNLSVFALLQKLITDKSSSRQVSVTVQFLNEEFAKLAWQETKEVKNIVLPRAVASKLTAEVVRDHRLHGLWAQLLSQEGRELYLLPATRYFSSAEVKPCSFAELGAMSWSKFNELAVGYIRDYSTAATAVINPTGSDRSEPVQWAENDMIVVLAEDLQ